MPLRESASGEVRAYPSPLTSLFLLLLGTSLLLLALVFPFITKPYLYDRIMGLLFLTLPGLGGGILTFMQGWLRLKTSLTLDRQGIQMRIPTWAGGLFLPLRTVHLAWEEIQRVTWTQRLYGIGMFLVKVDEYDLHTPHGRYTLVKAFCPCLEQILALITTRSGKGIENLGPERGYLFWRRAQ